MSAVPENITARLNRLKAVADIPITNLAGNHLDDLRILQNHTRLLYDTDDYSKYLKAAHKIFNTQGSIKPGTVRAYFVGCLTPTQNPASLDKLCSAICAGSMPLPRDGQTAKVLCDSNVYLITSKGNVQRLTRIATGNPGNSILMVESQIKSMDSAIKRELIKQGVDKVRIFRYSPDGRTTEAVVEKPLEISALTDEVFNGRPSNLPVSNGNGNGNGDKKSTSWTWLFLFIALIVAIFLLVYFLYVKPRKASLMLT